MSSSWPALFVPDRRASAPINLSSSAWHRIVAHFDPASHPQRVSSQITTSHSARPRGRGISFPGGDRPGSSHACGRSFLRGNDSHLPQLHLETACHATCNQKDAIHVVSTGYRGPRVPAQSVSFKSITAPTPALLALPLPLPELERSYGKDAALSYSGGELL